MTSKDIKHIIWHSLNSYPYSLWFFKLWCRLKGGCRVSTKGVNAVLDFYPRCANTFIYSVYKELYPHHEVAHHIHGISQLSVGLKYNKPTYFVIREPLDTISSLILRENLSCHKFCIKRYVKMYQYIWENRHKINLINFQDLENPKKIISKFSSNEYSNTEIKNIFEKAVKNTQYMDEKAKGKRLSEKDMSLPSKEKEEKKAYIKEDLKKYALLKQAESFYEKLSKYERPSST